MFKEGLRDAGIKVGGKVKVDEVPRKLRDAPELGTYESETIASLAAATNKPSNNFYAEMLLKRLAATPEHQGTTRRGTKIVERFARRLGSGVEAKDGSGLTNSNKSSPRDVVALLDAVRDEKGIGNAFVDSLAQAGKEGTLDDRMQRNRRRRPLPRQDRARSTASPTSPATAAPASTSSPSPC